MRWVTRRNPHVERCASIWLIKDFIDRGAVFTFISRADPIRERHLIHSALCGDQTEKWADDFQGTSPEVRN